jgi:hypothetical protein
MNISKLLSSALLVLTMGCSKGFQSLETSSLPTPGGGGTNPGGDGGGNDNGGSGGPVDTGPTWEKVELENSGFDFSKTNSGKLAVSIDKKRELMQLILPLPQIFLLAIGQVVVKELPGSLVEEVDLPDGSGKAWAVSIPLKYLVRGASLPEKFDSLPNGDSLPFLPSGEVQGLTIQFSQKAKYSIRFYLSRNAVAFFVATPDMDKILNEIPESLREITRELRITRLRNKAQTRVTGYIEVILPKNNSSSGLYMAARLTDSAARSLNSILKY